MPKITIEVSDEVLASLMRKYRNGDIPFENINSCPAVEKVATQVVKSWLLEHPIHPVKTS